jgi:hypothetical protein
MNNQGPLLEATRQARHAASVGDLAALEASLAARRAALSNASVAERVAAFQEGESIQLLLKGIKRRIRDQQGRLEQIKTGLARTVAPRSAKIDLRA